MRDFLSSLYVFLFQNKGNRARIRRLLLELGRVLLTREREIESKHLTGETQHFFVYRDISCNTSALLVLALLIFFCESLIVSGF